MVNQYLFLLLEVVGSISLRCVGLLPQCLQKNGCLKTKAVTETMKSAAQLATAQAHIPLRSGTKLCLTNHLTTVKVCQPLASNSRGIPQCPQDKACCLPSAPDAAGGNCSTDGSQASGQDPFQNGVRLISFNL